jgi:hypothetical protein
MSFISEKKEIAGILFFIVLLSGIAFAETDSAERSAIQYNKFSLCTTWHTFMNWDAEPTNIHMYEIHFGYRITEKDTVGIKAATWKLFEPMGIQLWDSHLMKESEYYPGRLFEYGLGVTYQRTIWKGLFAAIEILPLKQEYLNESGEKIKEGFRLYTTYHVGYRISLFHDRVYLAPQVHCNYWPIMTDAPEGFKERETRDWAKNYVLFEPNIYIGINF